MGLLHWVADEVVHDVGYIDEGTLTGDTAVQVVAIGDVSQRQLDTWELVLLRLVIEEMPT
ncbi:MAG: hypothetical protein ACHQIG_02785 [Acidimicrobiia bacterium]